MFYRTHLKAEEIRDNYKPVTKYDKMRLEEMNRLIANNEANGFADAGIAGKVFEIAARPSTSRLIGVQRNQEFTTRDCRFKVRGRYFGTEIKTQGGRLGKLFRRTRASQENTILLYYMCIEKTGRKNKPDTFDEVTVCTTLDVFLDTLKATKGAIKYVEHKNINDREEAIQVTMTVLKALKNLDVGTFDRNNIESYF